ncbi:peroxidase 63 isoform X1 [Physcomitrium patens]|uniref:Peroxidase n=2 Tax=Physcomitrium patens TaxID=3218 RepID=A0A2K1JPM5_PHYPA|nr:peroxidase 63-like isoform X1 [Physcomitrium patens]PNR43489.1 hypothetical protein PHYPA_015870 [Physcomitrium patens]|eukprot:XP_024390037.1 peroxidase 63-like isoform X1 [Physcomitrella patens]
MKNLGVIGVVYGLMALATLQVASAWCPFAGRRSLLQAAAPAPLPARPTGPDPSNWTMLNYDFYTAGLPENACPSFQNIVKKEVAKATVLDSLTPAFLLRLFFHDCFVMGCDASVLINSTLLNLAEKDQTKSFSLNKFNVVDDIKTALEVACPGVVSCADILAAAAVECVEQSGGPHIDLAYGRRDGLESFAAAAATYMPGGFLRVQGLIESFQMAGLDEVDLVALSGAHTLGQARCSEFIQERFISPGSNSFRDSDYGLALQSYCAEGKNLGLDRKVTLDSNTSTIFDNGYFQTLVDGRGVLTSDNDLTLDNRTAPLVQLYASDQNAFFTAFAASMRKMSKIGILTGTQGQVRKKCYVRNSVDVVKSPNSNTEFSPISPTICKPAPQVDQKCDGT